MHACLACVPCMRVMLTHYSCMLCMRACLLVAHFRFSVFFQFGPCMGYACMSCMCALLVARSSANCPPFLLTPERVLIIPSSGLGDRFVYFNFLAQLARPLAAAAPTRRCGGERHQVPASRPSPLCCWPPPVGVAAGCHCRRRTRRPRRHSQATARLPQSRTTVAAPPSAGLPPEDRGFGQRVGPLLSTAGPTYLGWRAGCSLSQPAPLASAMG